MNIYVGNLSYEVTEKDLIKSFGKYGEIMSAIIIRDGSTKKSLGFAHVIMGGRARCAEALSDLNHTYLMGRKLMLKEMCASGRYLHS